MRSFGVPVVLVVLLVVPLLLGGFLVWLVCSVAVVLLWPSSLAFYCLVLWLSCLVLLSCGCLMVILRLPCDCLVVVLRFFYDCLVLYCHVMSCHVLPCCLVSWLFCLVSVMLSCCVGCLALSCGCLVYFCLVVVLPCVSSFSLSMCMCVCVFVCLSAWLSVPVCLRVASCSLYFLVGLPLDLSLVSASSFCLFASYPVWSLLSYPCLKLRGVCVSSACCVVVVITGHTYTYHLQRLPPSPSSMAAWHFWVMIFVKVGRCCGLWREARKFLFMPLASRWTGTIPLF